MKTKAFSILMTLAIVIAGSMAVKASDNDSTKIEKKIIKVMTSDEKGTIMIDSTITTENGKTVVHVDTTKFEGMPPRFGRAHHRMDRMDFGKNNGEKHVEMEMESGDGPRHFSFYGNQMGNMMAHMNQLDSMPCGRMMDMFANDFTMPEPPMPPMPPKQAGRFRNHQSQEQINLNDPSVISFEKKIQKDGTEKITIIRKLQ